MWRRGKRWPESPRAQSGRQTGLGGERSLPRFLEKARRARGSEGTVVILAWPAYANCSLNPYTSLLYSSLSARIRVVEFSWSNALLQRADIFHLHWPETMLHGGGIKRVFRLSAYAVVLCAMAIRRTKVVWTVHNVRSHESTWPLGERLMWWMTSKRLAGTIHLTRSSVVEATRRFPRLARTPAAVIPHGIYTAPQGPSGAASKARPDGITQMPQVLWFGRIRAYKGIDSLITACLEDKSASWTAAVAGLADDEALLAEIREQIGGSDRVRLRPGHLTEQELDSELAASMLVCLPYRSIHNSGSAFRALSSARPVLLPDAPSTRELQEAVGAEWVKLFEGELTPEAVRSALASAPRGGAPNLDAFSWEQIASSTELFYDRLVHKLADR
jgi:beta-1,4-mannosyltransferase